MPQGRAGGSGKTERIFMPQLILKYLIFSAILIIYGAQV
jgi:hypothetical protein